MAGRSGAQRSLKSSALRLEPRLSAQRRPEYPWAWLPLFPIGMNKCESWSKGE